VKEVFVTLIGTVRSSEAVKVIVSGHEALADAERRIGENYGTKGVSFHRMPVTDVWIRDYGPTFLMGRNTLAGVKWVFNAWGGKYKDLERDDAIGFRVLESSTALGFFANGVRKVIWLERGIQGDDTDGHVDTFVRFAPDGVLLVAEERRKESPNYAVLKEVHEVLSAWIRETGPDSYIMVKVPMPSPVKVLGVQVPATYLNFLVTNRHVIVPVFGQPEDEEAVQRIAEAYEGREVVTVRSDELFYGLGGIHCVTLEVPEV
jgi:agmatine deiminase